MPSTRRKHARTTRTSPVVAKKQSGVRSPGSKLIPYRLCEPARARDDRYTRIYARHAAPRVPQGEHAREHTRGLRHETDRMERGERETRLACRLSRGGGEGEGRRGHREKDRSVQEDSSSWGVVKVRAG